MGGTGYLVHAYPCRGGGLTLGQPQVVDNWEEIASEEEEGAAPAVIESEGVKEDSSLAKEQEGVEPSSAQRQEPSVPLASQQSKSTETESESESSSEESDEDGEEEGLSEQQRAYNKAAKRIQVRGKAGEEGEWEGWGGEEGEREGWGGRRVRGKAGEEGEWEGWGGRRVSGKAGGGGG